MGHEGSHLVMMWLSLPSESLLNIIKMEECPVCKRIEMRWYQLASSQMIGQLSSRHQLAISLATNHFSGFCSYIATYRSYTIGRALHCQCQCMLYHSDGYNSIAIAQQMVHVLIKLNILPTLLYHVLRNIL